MRERRVSGPRRTLPSHYSHSRRNRRMHIERGGTSKDLHRSASDRGRVRSPSTYFTHDHRERENIRPLAQSPFLFQDFWCSPPCSATRCCMGVLYSGLVPGEAKICYTRTVAGVHHDVQLQVLISRVCARQ